MYRTIAQLDAAMNSLADTRPDLCTRVTLNNSIEGRPIHALRLRAGGGTNRRGILIVGGMHARELMNPDAIIALPTARPALMGPDAAVNGIYYNQIHEIADPEERRKFIAEKHAEYAEGIDVFKIANANAVEAVVPANELRADLDRRLHLYGKRKAIPSERRQAVTPV